MLRTGLALVSLVTLGSGCSGATDGTPSVRPTPAETSPTPSAPATSPPAPTATARPTPSPSPSPAAAGTYLALGDSLAVGVGATAPADLGYVGRLLSALRSETSPVRVAQLRNLAISGETSASMIAGGQLDAALEAIATADPPVAIVTLDIGGNDLLRLLGTETCQAAPLAQECLALLAQTLAAFDANFQQIVGELMAALERDAPGARLAVMTYFNPFSGTDAAYEAAAQLALLGTDDRIDCDAPEPQARGMNDIIACAGERLGATAVDIGPAFRGLGLELTHIGSDDIHANDAGYEVAADAFLRALRR